MNVVVWKNPIMIKEILNMKDMKVMITKEDKYGCFVLWADATNKYFKISCGPYQEIWFLTYSDARNYLFS